jgi:hypothetical protein
MWWIVRWIVVSYGTICVIGESKKPQAKGGIWQNNAQWVVDKFHGSLIPNFCFKVDVAIACVLDIPLIYLHEVDDRL